MSIDLKLYCYRDIVPPTQEKFSSSIQEIDGELHCIAEAQKKISITLQSCNVARDTIEAQYSAWIQEISDLSAKIKGCRGRIKQHVGYLAFLDHKTCVSGFQELSELERRSFLLKKKGKKLALLINSSEHQETFKLHKEIIRRCVKGTSVSSSLLDELIKKVENLIADQKESLSHVDPFLRKSIRVINNDSVNFLIYAANSTFPENTVLQEQLNGLIEVEETSSTLPMRQELTRSEDRYFTSFKDTALPNDRYFKNGIVQAGWRYPKIAKQIEKMNEIAKGLYQIETDLEKEIKQAWQGQITSRLYNYTTCLQVLGDNLTLQKNSLYSVDLCNQVHAGLHYATSLFIWMDEIQQQIDFYTEAISTSWQRVGELQQLFYKHLQPCSMMFSQMVILERPLYELYDIIKKLYDVSKATETTLYFEKQKKRIVTVIKEALARNEKAAFICYPEEKKVEESVLACSKDANMYFLKSHLAKKIVKYLHYTDDRFDLSLDLVLAALTQKEYTTSIRSDENLKELVGAYKVAARFEEDAHILTQFCDILELLRKCGESSATRFLIYEVLQRLFETNREVVNKERWSAFFKLVEEKVTTFTMLYDCPKGLFDDTEDGEKNLFLLLLEAIWAKDEQRQFQAQAAICDQAAYLEDNGMNGNISILLDALTLKMFLNFREPALSPLEKLKLPSLFSSYLNNPAPWYAQYGIGTMEWALYRFLIQGAYLQVEMPRELSGSLNTKRSEEPFQDTWKTTMQNYIEVKQGVENNKAMHNKMLAEEYQPHLITLERVCYKLNKKGNTYAHYIFNGLLEEMKGMIKGHI